MKDFHWSFLLLFSARSTRTCPAVYQIVLVHLVKLDTYFFISFFSALLPVFCQQHKPLEEVSAKVISVGMGVWEWVEREFLL